MAVGSALYQGYQQSQAQAAQGAATQAQGAYEASIYGRNAVAATASASSALSAGDVNASHLQTGAGLTIGAERASFGAQGVVVGQGSSGTVQASTMSASGIDAQQIRQNAIYQAFGIKTQAENDLMQGQFATMKGGAAGQASSMASRTSLITGGLNAANQYLGYQYRNSLLTSGRNPAYGSGFGNSF